MARTTEAFQINQDLKFQRREWLFQQAGWWCLAAFVAAALLGLFGGGPLSRARAGNPGGPLWVDYERFARVGTAARISIHTRAGDPPDPLELHIGRGLFENVRVEKITPEPVRTDLSQAVAILQFDPPRQGGTFTIVLDVEPLTPGPQRVDVQSSAGARQTFTQFVYF